MKEKLVKALVAITATLLIAISAWLLSSSKTNSTTIEKDPNYPYKNAVVWSSEERTLRTQVWMHIYSGAISRDGDERDASVKADNAVKAFDERCNAGFL